MRGVLVKRCFPRLGLHLMAAARRLWRYEMTPTGEERTVSTSAGDHRSDRELFTQIADREALAQIIVLTYEMQPNSMLNPAVPLLMADAILAAGFTRASVVAAPSATADWHSDETVRALRDGLRELVAPISTNQVPDPLDTLDALCDAVAVASARRISRRLDGIESVLTDMLTENAHLLVGGELWVKDSLTRLAVGSGKVRRKLPSEYAARAAEKGT